MVGNFNIKNKDCKIIQEEDKQEINKKLSLFDKILRININ